MVITLTVDSDGSVTSAVDRFIGEYDPQHTIERRSGLIASSLRATQSGSSVIKAGLTKRDCAESLTIGSLRVRPKTSPLLKELQT